MTKQDLFTVSATLEYIGWSEAGSLVTKSLENLFEKGYATPDLARFMEKGKALSTSEFASEVINSL